LNRLADNLIQYDPKECIRPVFISMITLGFQLSQHTNRELELSTHMLHVSIAFFCVHDLSL